nr:MAG TPA: hypothetical protein [Caudoviricetes sp.]
MYIIFGLFFIIILSGLYWFYLSGILIRIFLSCIFN